MIMRDSFHKDYKMNFSTNILISNILKNHPVKGSEPLPDFIAVWVPFILGTFMKPAEHPISAPPGKTGYGIDWNLTRITFVFV